MEQSFHRRNLPHLYFHEGQYFVTYRLANSIPHERFMEIEPNSTVSDFEKFKLLFRRYDKILDSANFGVSYLQQKDIIDIWKLTLHYPDGKDYKLICYCIMPNHIHLVYELLPGNKGISKIMQAIKGVSARKCNALLNRTGRFWHDESYDRWIRTENELYFVIKYVLLNPVSAGLVNNWEEWKQTYCHPGYCVL